MVWIAGLILSALGLFGGFPPGCESQETTLRIKVAEYTQEDLPENQGENSADN